MPPGIVVLSNIGAVIISEASVSFLGFGIPPPQPSWGGMLSIEGGGIGRFGEAPPADGK